MTTMTDRPGDWFQTYSGKKFYVLDPRPEDICIEDIAHSLSMLCRFNGHCEEFYSVAQHSVFVSEIVDSMVAPAFSPPEARLCALLHDAAEAYLGDMIRPLKRSLGPEFKRAEERVQTAIHQALMPRLAEAPELLMHEIKRADEVALATEKRDMVKEGEGTWKINARPHDCRSLTSWSPELAEEQFLGRYFRLTARV